MDGDDVCLYYIVPKLWSIGEASPKELKFLPEVYVEMVQLDQNINYPFCYY
jgi:hypothetical protein